MNKHRILLLSFLTLCVPVFALAQFRNFASRIVDILNTTVVLLMWVSLLAFIIGVIRFIATAGDDQSRAQGKQLMIWGTLSLFAMVAVWGLVGIIQATFFGP